MLFQIQRQLRQADVLKMPPNELEEKIAEMFSLSGICIVELTPFRRDEGRDLIVYVPGPSGLRVLYVQCKRYSTPVTVEAVRALMGLVPAGTGPSRLLVATSRYTSEAITEAKAQNTFAKQIWISLTEAEAMLKWMEDDPLNMGFGEAINHARQGAE